MATTSNFISVGGADLPAIYMSCKIFYDSNSGVGGSFYVDDILSVETVAKAKNMNNLR
jgi:hypothetical protein